MKIITGLGLAFLLVVGVWAATHPETDGTTPLAASAVMTSGGAGEAMAVDEVAGEVAFAGAVVTSDSAAVWADSSGGVVVGVAGCLLGVFCGVLLIGLIRLFTLRFRPRVLGLASRPAVLRMVVARLFTPPLTLSQLSLSRT